MRVLPSSLSLSAPPQAPNPKACPRRRPHRKATPPKRLSKRFGKADRMTGSLTETPPPARLAEELCEITGTLFEGFLYESRVKQHLAPPRPPFRLLRGTFMK